MDKQVKISNPDELNKKIKEFKSDGANGFHIISDFDRTLTKAFVNGQKTHTTIAQIREGKYLTQDYAPRAHALFDKYRPFEISHTISEEERNRKMNEWWSTHLELMIECGMNKGVIEDIVKKDKIQFREGSLELLDILAVHKIPLLIFSAGLGDIIQESLKSKNRLTENIHIISNFYKFDKEGKIEGYKSNIIHTFNKNELQVKKFPYHNEVEKRKNVILLGDSLGDLGILKGIPHDSIIKIGFLNEKVDELFEKYSKSFDILILNDGPMNYVNKLIKEIIK